MPLIFPSFCSQARPSWGTYGYLIFKNDVAGVKQGDLTYTVTIFISVFWQALFKFGSSIGIFPLWGR